MTLPAVTALKNHKGVAVWARLLREGAILAAAYYGFTLLKNLIAQHPVDAAMENAGMVVQFEQSLGLFREASFQQWLLRESPWAVRLFNGVYSWGYLPAIVFSALVGALWRPTSYAHFRNLALVTLGLAIGIFLWFPLAPPRMLPELGFVGTLDPSGVAHIGQGGHLLSYNKFAAMPSTHVGLSLIVALSWASTRARWLVAAAALYEALMVAAVIATGNHYFTDVIIAFLVVFAAWQLHGSLRMALASMRGAA